VLDWFACTIFSIQSLSPFIVASTVILKPKRHTFPRVVAIFAFSVRLAT